MLHHSRPDPSPRYTAPMPTLAHLLAFLSGTILPFQAGANAEIGRKLGHPLHGAVLNFVIGLLALLIASLAITRALPAPGKAIAAGVPWWAWVGGLCGAAYVVMTVFVGPRIGALNMLLAALVGQMVASIIVDKYGLVGFPVREITASRVVGVLLVMVGLFLVMQQPKPVA